MRSVVYMVGAVALLVVSGTANGADRPINFSRDIRSILSDKCFKCHGPDENERKANLRLDIPEGYTAKLDSGVAAVVPGNLSESELIERLTTDDPSLKMPPPATGKTLTAEQIDVLKRWVAEGAEWKPHWAFQTPQRPAVPEVKHTGWARNPIDQFVLARLELEGLAPAAQADKTTLIRRATLDLTGLPPTPAEVAAFLADESPTAYETVIDRLLASPRYGEHMARFWLDAARYGDTHGLHLDNERSLWPYRDWVINSFNNNLPFDRFTIDQMAGDLLPESTLDQRIASGFQRNNVTTGEGGSINEEVLVRYAVDRVETMSTVYLGLTLGCAVCHDHKFDPVSQKEFYSMYAFYNGVADQAMDGNALLPPPAIKLPTAEQTAKLAEFDKLLAETQQKIVGELAKIEYQDPVPAGDTTALDAKEFVWIDDDIPAGGKPQGSTEWKWQPKSDGPVFSGERASTRTATELSQHFFTEANPPLKVGEGDILFAHVFLDPANPPKEIMLQWNDGTWEHRAIWGEDVIPWGAPNSPSRMAMGPLPEAGKWVRLEVPAEKVGLKSGALVNGLAFTQHAGTVSWDSAGIVTRTPQAGQTFESLAVWAKYMQAQNYAGLPAPVAEAMKVEADKRNEAQTKTIRDYFLENVYVASKAILEPIRKEIDSLAKQRTDFDNAIPQTMVMAEMTQPRETFILVRGAYDKKGDKVTAGVPAVLPPLPQDAPLNRLGLAKWLVDPNHPLTARVTINRYWQQFFGQGLVKTSEDFGVQGGWPSHPELLDWLAVEFTESGWNLKHMQKLMLLSATYQQSSAMTPEQWQRDPSNELLARGPRFRLDAEVIRDTALAVSGLLVERLGGKSVKPYQPDGIWESVAFVGSNTSNFKRDSGEALYRRSMYTFWKRTSPPPGMLTFDAPSRENCSVRRARTNTPLQALALMNDEQYVEAARAFGQRIMTEGGATPDDRIRFAYQWTLGRAPQPRELEVVQAMYAAELAVFQADVEGAKKLLVIGESKRNEALDPAEHAAWTLVANLLLNLDETVTKE